jgi:hypothetical protein
MPTDNAISRRAPITTAVLLTGEARTFSLCLRTQQWALFRKLPNPTFYCCVEDNEQAKDMEGLYDLYPRDRVHIKRLKTPTDLPQPDEKYYDGAPYPRSGPTKRLIGAIWNMNEAWNWYAGLGGTDSLVVKLRCDAYFHEFYAPSRLPEADEAMTLWWERYGGINDRVAFFGRKAAEAYFTTYQRIHQILAAGCSLHGESLMGGSLHLAGMRTLHILNAWLSFIRLPDSGNRMEQVPPKALPWEIAEFARNQSY